MMKRLFLIIPAALIMLLATCRGSADNNDGNSDTEMQSLNTESGNLKTRLLAESNLEGKSAEELRIMRNEIFARHGYKFKSKDLQKHFSKFDWYEAKYDDVTDKLSETEQKNIALIKKYEDKASRKGKASASFSEFLALFERIESGKEFVINVTEWDKYKTRQISKKFAEAFLGAEIVYQEELECHNVIYTAISKFSFPDGKKTGVFVHETICPVPAAYDEIYLFVFDENGNRIDRAEVAYTRGAMNDAKLASSVFKDMKLTKTVKRIFRETGADGLEEKTETEQYKIEFGENGKVKESKM